MTERKSRKVSVVGLGKLGLCLAAVLASKGFKVRGVELDQAKVKAVNSGKSPIYEPGLDELIHRNRDRLTASSNFGQAIAETDVTFVVVPTPSDESGAFSLRFVEPAMRSIGKALASKEGYHLIVLTSTVMPRSMDGTVKPALEKSSGKVCGKDFGLCYNPEFIALSDVIRGLLRPDFILIGESDPRAGRLLSAIQRRLCDNSPPMERMEFVNAEVSKIAVNSYVTMKMSFANTLAEIAEKIPGGNVDRITSAIGKDRRIGTAYLKGALGYGGPCVPPETPVVTLEGLKPIRDVKVGERVLSHDGLFHSVTRTFQRDYNGEMVTIAPEGSPKFSLTPEHPILSSPRVLDERRRYQELSGGLGPDGFIRSGKGLLSMTSLLRNSFEWRPSSDVKHGDLLAYPKPRFPLLPAPVIDFSVHRSRKSKFPDARLLDVNLARLVGYYVSEGSTWKSEIRFDFNSGEGHLIGDVIRIVQGFGYKARAVPKSKNGVTVRFKSAPLADFFRREFGRGAVNKHLPPSWLGLPNEILDEILRGVWYGDGSVSTGVYTLGTTSSELASQVRLILLGRGIACSLGQVGEHRGSDGVWHQSAYLVRVLHPREIAKLTLILEWLPIRQQSQSERKTIWIEEDLLNYHVMEIGREGYSGRVYNLEVEQSNSYCLQGGALHNCFPRDNVAFARFAETMGAQARLAETTHEVNLHQTERLLSLAKKSGLRRNSRVGILGLSYKPKTNIVEESQSLVLAQRLAGAGHHVTVFDPAAMDNARVVLGPAVDYAGSAEACLSRSDFVILATPWEEFRNIRGSRFKGKVVMDCWRFLGDDVKRASKYVPVGQG